MFYQSSPTLSDRSIQVIDNINRPWNSVEGDHDRFIKVTAKERWILQVLRGNSFWTLETYRLIQGIRLTQIRLHICKESEPLSINHPYMLEGRKRPVFKSIRKKDKKKLTTNNHCLKSWWCTWFVASFGCKITAALFCFFISRLALPLFRTPDKRLQEGLELPDYSQYKSNLAPKFGSTWVTWGIGAQLSRWWHWSKLPKGFSRYKCVAVTFGNFDSVMWNEIIDVYC